jgi:methionyl-tRNA synthetase
VKSFYITTAIDYSNGSPHLGHAFEKIGADVIARYRRMRGDDVRFLIGMDEHGQKVAQSAAASGVSPAEWTGRIADEFQAAWRRLDISHDQFIRTTEPGHAAGVTALIERIFERNPDDFYEQSYEGWYCVGCEMFKRDNEIVDGRCVLHSGRDLEWTEERNWFFRLSRHRDFLRQLLDDQPDFLQPASRRNEILALLDGGLDDISVTRARLEWAIPFPRATSDGQTQGTWVWFDALPNYLTATGFPEPGWEDLWPAQLHIVGKDITRLHAVIWPAMLRSAELPLPERVWAHGFVQLAGEKLSKSSGVQLDLDDAIDRFGVDAFRYFLLREVPWDGDGNFSWERFEDRYVAELANDLGNLASRTIAMVVKYREGRVPAGRRTELDDRADRAVKDYNERMERLLLDEGASSAIALVRDANAFVGDRAPWTLAKDPSRADDLDDALASLVRTLGVAAILLSPFMPRKTAELRERLGAPDDLPGVADLSKLDPDGWTVSGGDVLFPRPESGEK